MKPDRKEDYFRKVDDNQQPIWFEIVGVVANVRSLELREEPIRNCTSRLSQDLWPTMSLVVRSSVEPVEFEWFGATDR